MILTLTEAKEAANIGSGQDEWDLLIQAYSDAAQIWIERVTGKIYDPAPEDVKQAARMLVAFWFINRDAATETARTAVPYGVSAMLATRRSFAHGYVSPAVTPPAVAP